MTSRKQARDAIYDGITRKAEAIQPDTETGASELESLARAYSAVKFGPQGGDMHNDTDYNYNADTTQRYEGVGRPNGTGFGVR